MKILATILLIFFSGLLCAQEYAVAYEVKVDGVPTQVVDVQSPNFNFALPLNEAEKFYQDCQVCAFTMCDFDVDRDFTVFVYKRKTQEMTAETRRVKTRISYTEAAIIINNLKPVL